jgi:hypothetical protein
VFAALRNDFCGGFFYGGMPLQPKSITQMDPRSILCLFNRHDPDRQKARWEGLHYVGKCRHCGRDIYRRKAKTWRAIGSG